MRCLAILAAALLGSAGAAGSGAATEVPIYPLGEVHPGLVATALTVLSGETPDSFQVEVLGILQRGEAGSHLILVRALDERIARTGIAAGMSGSPLHVGGRLLGALAYGFTGATEPIGAATPIEEMLAELEAGGLAGDGEPGALRGSPQLDAGTVAPFAAWRPEWVAELTAGRWPPSVLAGGEGLPTGLQPIALPLFLGGRLGGGFEGGASLWGALGLAPMPLSGVAGIAPVGRGGGTGEGLAGERQAELAPGDAFGISLITGDLVAAAIGTVTWREGQRILGLGHPFMQVAPAEFPISRARIHAIVPTRGISFKLGSPLEEVGCLRRDGRPGVAGELGARARGIPLRVAIVPRPGSAAHDYEFEVARHLILSPAFLVAALHSVLTGETQVLGPASLRTRVEITLDDGRGLAREDFFQTLGPGQTAANILAPVAYLGATSLAPFSVREVAVEIESVAELRAVEVEQIRVPRPRVKAGENLTVEIRLRHHLGAHETRRVELAIPERVRGERLRVMVGSAAAFFEWDRERAPQKYIPRVFDDLVAQIEDYPSDENLIVRLYGPSRGLVLRGAELASLPLSKWRTLQGTTSGGKAEAVGGLMLAEQRVPMGAVVLGGQVVELEIED